MKGFRAWVYLRRVAKYILFYTLFILALLAIVYFTTKDPSITFKELISPQSRKDLILLIIAFSAVYPFIGFVKKDVHVNKFTEEDKEKVCHMAAEAGFFLVSDENGQMIFKARRFGMRLFRVFEDKITLDYHENPLVMDGMRRDVQRIARHMEYYFRQVEKE
ncbi:MAG: hypothetical protein GX877_07125 [Bacteroidales bacterium]|nr:hypothetical protein [Bacteroidales bacterium]